MSQKFEESAPQGVEIGRDRKKMRRSVWQKNSNSGFDFVAKNRNKTSFGLFLQILLFIWLFQKILDCKLISFFFAQDWISSLDEKKAASVKQSKIKVITVAAIDPLELGFLNYSGYFHLIVFKKV